MTHIVQRWRLTRLVVCLAIVLLIGACGGSSEHDRMAQSPTVTSAGNSVPLPSSLPRTAATIDVERMRYGSDYASELSKQRISSSGTRGHFTPDWDPAVGGSFSQVAYAIYEYNLPDFAAQAVIDYAWQGTPEYSDVNLGLANWELDRWEWFAGDASQHLAFDDLEAMDAYFDPAGRLLICIILIGTDTADLEFLSVGGNLGPEADLIAAPDTGDKPLNVLLDASGSFDVDGTIVQYEFDFGTGNGFENFGAVNQQSFIYEEYGTYDVQVRIRDDGGLGDIAQSIVEVADPPNVAPVATLFAIPASGDSPLSVTLDGTGSTDSDGMIINYEFKVDESDDWTSIPAGETINVYNFSGVYVASLRVTDNELATHTVTAPVVVNDAPIPSIMTANPTDGLAPLTVTFDLNAFDPDGTIVSYEIDFDEGNGYEDTTADLHPTKTFTIPDEYNVTLRVTDNFGSQATASMEIIARGWHKRDLGLSGTNCILTKVNGKPGIAYLNDTTINYIAAQTYRGKDWSTPSTAASGIPVAFDFNLDGDDVLTNPSLAWTNGGALHFASASDTAGSAWNSPVVVEDSFTVGWDLGLIGNPFGSFGIAFHNADDGDLYWAYSADGLSFTTVAVETSTLNNLGTHVSACRGGGLPMTAYLDATNGAIHFSRSSQTDGSSGWSVPDVVYSGGNTLGRTDLSYVASAPTLLYVTDVRELFYARKSGPSLWNISTALTSSSDVTFPCLSVYDGKPVVVAVTDDSGSDDSLNIYYGTTATDVTFSAGEWLNDTAELILDVDMEIYADGMGGEAIGICYTADASHLVYLTYY